MTISLKIAVVILCSTIGVLFAPELTSLAASSNPLDQACSQGTAKDSAICKQAAAQGTANPISGPSGVISKAANIIASVTAIGAIIMVLIGGFFYVTSAGNSESAGKAKARIASGFIGLIIVALAWAFVRLISDKILK